MSLKICYRNVAIAARTLAVFAVMCIGGVAAFAQDGSDMNYINPNELTDTYVGRSMHIDFYRNSRWTSSCRCERKVDKVELEINGEKVEFIERRNDDWFNNWFIMQYLESADKKIRIREFKLVKFDEKTVTVTAYLNIKPFEKEFTFNRSDITQYLVKMVTNK